MRRKLPSIVLLSTAIVTTAVYTRRAGATPSAGFVATTLGVGRFGENDVFNYFIPPNNGQGERQADAWVSFQKMKGSSDLYVQSNVFMPGGTSGWHTHPGHSLIIVTEGTVTVYEGDEPGCKPVIYTKGMGFVDRGGEHMHNIRNEGSIEAHTIAVQLIPADATRRIDAEAPKNCPF